MIDQFQYAKLGAHLDFQNFDLLNCSEFDPVPAGIVGTSDARLTDNRPVASGTVTNDKVNAAAAIGQSKLSLNGDIPGSWLGIQSNQAAQGNLVQLASGKDVLSGYSSLDSSGKVPVGNLPSTGPQSGTVTKVELATMEDLPFTGSPVTTTGSFAVSWSNQPDQSWLGVHGPIGMNNLFLPSFLVKPLPISLIPDLEATKFTSGLFPVTQLPEAVGMGINHAKGIVPDPGDGTNGMADEYLGRDMKYHHFDTDVSYQPEVPDVGIALESYDEKLDEYKVSIQSKLSGSVLFYHATGDPDFIEVHPDINGEIRTVITLALGDVVKAYAAKSGYNNSPIAMYTVSLPMITP